MSKKIFFILEGRNGATYIFNSRSNASIEKSLRFYKARVFKQKLLKHALKMYFRLLNLTCKSSLFCKLQSAEEIEKYLRALSPPDIDFNVDENCSVLISPTRDKVIVHHHDAYFQKFAFGKSHNNVKNEADIYELLSKPMKYFRVSTIYDYINDRDAFCSFKLSAKDSSKYGKVDMVSALLELFSATKKVIDFEVYIGDLISRYKSSSFKYSLIGKTLQQLLASSPNKKISLGLVHRDFKYWNINMENGLLIYDFEEAVVDGPPLEDMFNFYVDPVVRYQSANEVAGIIFDTQNVKKYQSYLKALNVELDYRMLLYCFLIERALFWMNANDKKTADKYCQLFHYVITIS
jgi:hypothetical protein